MGVAFIRTLSLHWVRAWTRRADPRGCVVTRRRAHTHAEEKEVSGRMMPLLRTP